MFLPRALKNRVLHLVMSGQKFILWEFSDGLGWFLRGCSEVIRLFLLTNTWVINEIYTQRHTRIVKVERFKLWIEVSKKLLMVFKIGFTFDRRSQIGLLIKKCLCHFFLFGGYLLWFHNTRPISAWKWGPPLLTFESSRVAPSKMSSWFACTLSLRADNHQASPRTQLIN